MAYFYSGAHSSHTSRIDFGKRTFETASSASYTQFAEQTGISFEANLGIDASVPKDEWRGASVMTEVVLADFMQQRLNAQAELESFEDEFEESRPAQGLLFPNAA